MCNQKDQFFSEDKSKAPFRKCRRLSISAKLSTSLRYQQKHSSIPHKKRSVPTSGRGGQKGTVYLPQWKVNPTCQRFVFPGTSLSYQCNLIYSLSSSSLSSSPKLFFLWYSLFSHLNSSISFSFPFFLFPTRHANIHTWIHTV